MDELWKLLGMVGPPGFLTGIAIAVVQTGKYLDRHLKPETRTRYVDYLRNGGLNDASKSLVDVAGEAVDIVFGPDHFSLKCLLRSIAFTLGSIALFVTLSGFISLYISFLGNETVNKFLEAYWTFPLKVTAWGLITWLVWSVIVDFFRSIKQGG